MNILGPTGAVQAVGPAKGGAQKRHPVSLRFPSLGWDTGEALLGGSGSEAAVWGPGSCCRSGGQGVGSLEPDSHCGDTSVPVMPTGG